MSELQFKGYAIHDTSKWTEFKLIEFQPKTFQEDDVDIKIECCGVCGSDVHTITGGWGQPIFPVIVGHEIVGTVAKVGAKVTEFKVGQRVGVGAQICSCGACSLCTNDNENYCHTPVYTYNSEYPNGDLGYGGYSTAIRANQRFVFPIPDALSSEQAAPMLCGGLTVFSPLLRHGAGPGKRVAVVGMGGLGHYAVQFAKALGAEVVVLSHSRRKKADAKALGADQFIVTAGEGSHFATSLERTVDLIILTANVSEGMYMNELLSTLSFQGKLVIVAHPNDPLPPILATSLLGKAASITGSSIGSKKEAIQMLNIAVEKSVKSWIEVKNMSEAGEAVKRVHEGDVRYRFVLRNDIPK